MKPTNFLRMTAFVLSLTLGSTSFAQSLHTRIFEAQTAIANQNWSGAESILSPLNQANPNNPYVLYELAQVYENTNRLDDAKKIYQDFSKLPSAKLSEYVVLVRSAAGVQTTNLASLTPTSLERIAAKQPQVAAAPVAVLPVAEAPKAAAVATNPQASVTTTPASVEASVTAAVQNWATAWANKDMPAYFASFVKNFQGGQASPSAWMKSRQANIMSKKFIELDLSDMQVTTLSANKAQISFKQSYTSDTIKNVSNKALLMTKVGNTWLIEKETIK